MQMGVKSNSHGVVFIEMSNVWHSLQHTDKKLFITSSRIHPAQPYLNRHFAMRNDLR